jgi:hypothetical protein
MIGTFVFWFKCYIYCIGLFEYRTGVGEWQNFGYYVSLRRELRSCREALVQGVSREREAK